MLQLEAFFFSGTEQTIYILYLELKKKFNYEMK